MQLLLDPNPQLTLVSPPSAHNDNLQVHEEKNRGVYVKGLTQYNVSDASEVFEIMKQGQSARVTSSTSEYELPDSLSTEILELWVPRAHLSSFLRDSEQT